MLIYIALGVLGIVLFSLIIYLSSKRDRKKWSFEGGIPHILQVKTGVEESNINLQRSKNNKGKVGISIEDSSNVKVERNLVVGFDKGIEIKRTENIKTNKNIIK